MNKGVNIGLGSYMFPFPGEFPLLKQVPSFFSGLEELFWREAPEMFCHLRNLSSGFQSALVRS